MRVASASELFSDRVAIAMKMLHDRDDGNEALKDHEPTHKFIMLVHNLIEPMTSRDKTNSPHCDKSCKNRKVITDLINFLENWEYGMEVLEFPMPSSNSTVAGLTLRH